MKLQVGLDSFGSAKRKELKAAVLAVRFVSSALYRKANTLSHFGD